MLLRQSGATVTSEESAFGTLLAKHVTPHGFQQSREFGFWVFFLTFFFKTDSRSEYINEPPYVIVLILLDVANRMPSKEIHQWMKEDIVFRCEVR